MVAYAAAVAANWMREIAFTSMIRLAIFLGTIHASYFRALLQSKELLWSFLKECYGKFAQKKNAVWKYKLIERGHTLQKLCMKKVNAVGR